MKDVTYEGPPIDTTRPENIERSRGTPEAPVLRTFHTDVTDLVQEGKTTKTAVVVAEAERREARGESPLEQKDDERHLGRIIFFLFLVFAFGIGVGVYVLLGTKISIPFFAEKTIQETKPIETADDASVMIGSISRKQILSDIDNIFGKTTLALGNTRVVTFTADNTHENATTSALLLAVSAKTPPKELLRSLEDVVTYRIYATNENLVGVLSLQSRSYPESFAGMLKWEQNMGDDLIPALNPNVTEGTIKLLRGRVFKDERILGVDARVLSDPDNISPLAYAFLDQKTLLISGGREGLTVLIEKLHTKTN